MRDDPFRLLGWGVLLLVGGALLTGGTYVYAALTASPGASGTYYVFGGAMLWGGIYLLRGTVELAYWTKARRSGDPWAQAEYDAQFLYRLVADALTGAEPARRRLAARKLSLLGTALTAQAAAPLFVAAMTDPDGEVRAEGHGSLWRLARHREAQGNAVLHAMAATVWAQPAVGADWLRLRSFLQALGADKPAYRAWVKTGSPPPAVQPTPPPPPPITAPPR